eukprot:CAMPEP_0184326000 /NCGR_PEP_ID=MMETSP1049-20130417/142327_1 /TAXON_ID=77928 /ORGANISM="Proteomonas sulcata, Strain CCMP704" /LENGTH=307 /DNA_ID=CAMNT_0026648169 /DNA_START=3442 /DNA_END=4365 /DNA_ORIENTATION=+
MSSAPVNPSDYGAWRQANPSQTFPMPIGNEGSGVVIGSGGGVYAGSLVGKTVGVLAAQAKDQGTYQEYITLPATAVFPMKDVPVEDVASFFVNPVTAYAIYDISKTRKSKAVVHTAAASQLGQMLVKLCKMQGDMVPINVVRRQDQADILKAIDPSVPVVVQANSNWETQLTDLIKEYKCSVAFDAVAGELTGTIVGCMPPKSITYVYGGLSGQGVGNVPVMDLIYKHKKVEGFLVVNWINFKDPIGALLRMSRALKIVNQGLKPGGWATSQFKDCTLADMKDRFNTMMGPGGSFTGQKLRIMLNKD